MNCMTSNYNLKIKKRIQLVHIAKNELRISDEDYRLLLAAWKDKATKKPCSSSKQLDWHQLGELLDAMKSCGFKLRPKTNPAPLPAEAAVKAHNSRTWRKYDPSIQGLKDEICDLAKARFGESWELPLNNFCKRFGVCHWKWLDVSHGKAVKQALVRLSQDPGPAVPDAMAEEVPF